MMTAQIFSDTKKVKKSRLILDIIETKNYGAFRTFKGNRPVNKQHVKNLMVSIMRQNLLAQNPIMVNKDYEIIDGQHRLEAAKGLELPIYYIVVDEATLSTIHLLNANVRQWTTDDYMNGYIGLKIQPYVVMKEFLDEYDFSLEIGFLLLFSDNRATMYRTFKSGDLKVSDEQLKVGRDKANYVLSIYNYFTEGKPRSKYFYRAFNKVYAEGLAEELLERLEKQNPSLQQAWTLKDYLRLFEDVLNFKKSSNLTRLF